MTRIPFIAFFLAATVAGQWQPAALAPEPAPAALPLSKPARIPDVFPGPPPTPLPAVKLSGPYCSGFIEVSAVSQDLKVLTSFRGSVLATEGDFIYLSQGSRDGIAVGSLYQVIRPTKRMESASGRTKNERNLGMHYLQIARINVVLAQPEFSLARVLQTCDAIEIGDIAEPLQISEPPVEAGPRTFSPFMTVSGAIKGAVVTTLSALLNFGTIGSSRALAGVTTGYLSPLEKGLAHEGTIVYVDVGQREGVKPGDLFIVYRRLQLNKDFYPLPSELRRLQGARTAIGELIVVKAGERASAALVTYSDDTISAGDSVERR